MNRKIAASLVLLSTLSACAGIEGKGLKASGNTAAAGERDVFTTVDGLLREQAREMANRMGWVDRQSQTFKDYDVEVYYGGPVIGSLIEDEYGNLTNSSACAVKTVSETDMNAFSSYSLTSSVALQLGLPIPSVPIGVNAKHDITTSYALSEAKIKLLDQDELQDLENTPACKTRIAKAKGSVWIVRGIVSAKRSYNFSRVGSAGLTLNVPNSNNSFSNGGGVVGAGTDSAARAYFMILSPVTPQAAAAAPPPAPATAHAAPANGLDSAHACDENFGNPLYIQRDATDAPNTGVTVRSALSGKFNVETWIEPEKVMPDHTEVRYYYAADLPAANCALSTLKSHGYPNAILNPRNRPAPAKLLEVWLAKK